LDDIKRLDIKFDHRIVGLIAVKAIPKLVVGDIELGPIDSGASFEIQRWIADEFIRSGVARLADATSEMSLTKVQEHYIKETMQPSRRLSTLPEDFYPKLRRLLNELSKTRLSDPDKTDEFRKMTQLSTDILTVRLNKILLLSSAHGQNEDVLKNLTPDEKLMYATLHKAVENWRRKVFEYGEVG